MISPFARSGFFLAVLCAIVVGISGPGYRMGWWPLPVAFGMFRWTAYAAIAAVLIGAAAAVLTRPGGTRQDPFRPEL